MIFKNNALRDVEIDMTEIHLSHSVGVSLKPTFQ